MWPGRGFERGKVIRLGLEEAPPRQIGTLAAADESGMNWWMAPVQSGQGLPEGIRISPRYYIPDKLG